MTLRRQQVVTEITAFLLCALFLACCLDVLYVLSEAIAGVPVPPRHVFAEPHLTSEASTGLHGPDLPAFGVADGDRGSDDVVEPGFRKKENAISVCDNAPWGDPLARREGGPLLGAASVLRSSRRPPGHRRKRVD
jgi:hypothetical protein